MERLRTLVAGWFSFADGHATAGDVIARDLVCDWLSDANQPFDIAFAEPFDGNVRWTEVDPARYGQVIFVCGPFEKRDWLEIPFVRKFENARLVGINLSMPLPLADWNPFDLLIERDSDQRTRPDVVFHAPSRIVPVVGVCLVEPYEAADTVGAERAIRRLLGTREVACVSIDTRLDENGAGLRTAPEIESLIARMDVVVTTRLHGLVLALKNGVPALAIDAEPGGAKILRQARHIGWREVFVVDDLDDDALRRSLGFCLSDAGRLHARECGERAQAHWREEVGAIIERLTL
jgi:hypothetical protein